MSAPILSPTAAAINAERSAASDSIQPPSSKKLKRDHSSITSQPSSSSSSSTSTQSLTSQPAAPVGRSERAGLNFNVGEISRILKTQRVTSRVGGGAPVYLAAVLEYLTTELLDVAAHTAKQAHALASASDTDGGNNSSATVTITPEHIAEAVAGDEELKRVMDDNAKHEQSAASRLEHSSMHAVHDPQEDTTTSRHAHNSEEAVEHGNTSHPNSQQPTSHLPLPTSTRAANVSSNASRTQVKEQHTDAG